MKIVTVYFDDYDKPLIGRLIVNTQEEAEAIGVQVKERSKDAYGVDIEEPDTLESILKQADEMAEDDIGGE